MAFHFGVMKFLLVCALVDRAFLVPLPAPRSSSTIYQQDRPPKLVEIKLPVKITSMEDLVAWAKNAMRSMASRIDITLASVNEPVDDGNDGNRERVNSLPSESRHRQREPVSLSFESRRPIEPSALLSTFASLLNAESSYDSVIEDQNDLNRDLLPYGNVNAYLPLLVDDLEISKYREEALRKYYVESEQQAKRDKHKNESKDKTATRYSQAIAQQTSNVRVSNNEVKSNLVKSHKDSEKPTSIISVPFEAVVTITRENAPEPTRKSFEETRDPPDEFPPYFEKEYPRREIPGNPEFSTKAKDTAPKRQIASLGDILRMLGLTKRLTAKKKDVNQLKGTNAESTNSKPRKPSEKFTPPPIIEFEDDPPRQRRNETSQRQELDDDEEEEEMGSLGSLADLIPLLIPVLEDLSDPESDTDLGEVLEAGIPLLEGLFGNDDPDSPNILEMIGPILMTILGGKDGTGSDVGALLGPLLQIVGPLVGPLSGPIVTAITGGGTGSSVASLISAVIAPLAQPGPDGNSPISIITARVLATVIKDLKPGQPGGLDIGALIGSVLSGVLSGASAGLSGSSSSDDKGPRPYGPYGAGPVQAGSVNTRTKTGYKAPSQQMNSLQQRYPPDQQRIPVPVNIVEHHRIVHHTSQRPYVNAPQRIHPGHPPPYQNYVQHHATGPVQAGTTNTGSGGSSYLPYGNNAVPAASANPLGLVTSSIKDILGGGINLVSSVINAVFGISGASSEEKPGPVYGPPSQGYN